MCVCVCVCVYIYIYIYIYSFKKNIREQKQAIFIADNNNVSWAVNQHIKMISEGSCDTEDWINDAENSALPSQELIIF